MKVMIIIVPGGRLDRSVYEKAQQICREDKDCAVVMTPKYDSTTKNTLDKHVTKPGLYVLT